jgi:TctA family transporter
MGSPLSFVDAVAEPPTLVGSQTLTVPSSVLSVDDIIWDLKVLLFFAAVTMVVCTIYRVTLWRSLAQLPQIWVIQCLLHHQEPISLQV